MSAYPADSLIVTCVDPLSFTFGMGITTIYIRPVQYRISQSQIWLYTDINFTIHTTATARTPLVAGHRSTFSQKYIMDYLKGLVENSSAVDANTPLPILCDYNDSAYLSVPPDFIIITSSSMKHWFTDLKTWKLQQGMPTRIFGLEDEIYPYYPGDNAEKLRNFIIDKATLWGTPYILLAGNMDIVPIRYAYPRVYPHYARFISDLYYAALDGNWNYDGDGYWGEPEDEVDLAADIFVGRVAFSGDSTEVATWLSKLKIYVDDPGHGNDLYLANVVIGSSDQMSNSRQPQNIAASFSSYFNIDTETLRERPSGHDTLPTWPYGQDVIDYLSQNPVGYYINLNHGSPHDYTVLTRGYNEPPWSVVTSCDGCQGGPMRHGYIGDVQNEGREYIHSSISCYVGALDANYWQPDTFPDCFAEESLVLFGGCVAGTFNTGYGLVYSSWRLEKWRTYWLCSEYYQHNLAIAHYAIKPAYADSGLLDLVHSSNYFGDPSMRVWTDDPRLFSLECAGVVYRDITQTMQVMVRDQATGIGISDVLVTITKEGEVYGRGFTDVTGRTYIPIRPDTEGQLRIEATRPNFYTFVDSVFVDTYCEPAVAGDANGNGVCNGLDVTFLQYYFQGSGPHPPDSCMCGDTFLYHAADANGNCTLNGVDIVYLVSYFKGGSAPRFCPACPTSRLVITDDKNRGLEEGAQ